MLSALAALSGCGRAAPIDPVAAYDRDPAGTLARISALPDDAARDAAILALAEARPGRVGALCGRAATRLVAERCDRFNARPHLAVSAGPRTSDDGEPMVDTALRTTWDGLSPLRDGCDPGTPSGRACLSDRARQVAATGDAEGAAARCLAQPAGLGRHDCFFAAAETVDVHRRTDRALRLCLGAGPLATECFGHVLQARVLADEAGFRAGTPDIAGLLAVEAGIRAPWVDSADSLVEASSAALDELSTDLVDLWWALTAATAVALAPAGCGDLGLPAVAGPHVRAAIAWRLRDAPAPVDATRAVAACEARLALDPGWVGTSGHAPGSLRNVALPDPSGEAPPPRVRWLGLHGGRRPVGPDPDTDLALALLAAQAGGPSPRADVLAWGSGSDHPLVRWVGEGYTR